MDYGELLFLPAEQIDRVETPLEPTIDELYENFNSMEYREGAMPPEIQIAFGVHVVNGRKAFLEVLGCDFPVRIKVFGGLQKERQLADAVYRGLKALDVLSEREPEFLNDSSSLVNGRVIQFKEIAEIVNTAKELLGNYNYRNNTKILLEDFLPQKNLIYTGIEAQRVLVSQFTREMYSLIGEQTDFIFRTGEPEQVAADMKTAALLGLLNSARNYNPFGNDHASEPRSFSNFAHNHIVGMLRRVVRDTIKPPGIKYNQFDDMGKVYKALDVLEQEGIDIEVISDGLIQALLQRLDGRIKYPVRNSMTPEKYIRWILDVRKARLQGGTLPLYDETFKRDPDIVAEAQVDFAAIQANYDDFVNSFSKTRIDFIGLMEGILDGDVLFDKQNSTHQFARNLLILKMKLGLLVSDGIPVGPMSLREISEKVGLSPEAVRQKLHGIAIQYEEFLRDEELINEDEP